MALITPDFSEDTSELAEGVYSARIVEATPGTSQRTGHGYVFWNMEIFSAEGDYAKFNGRKVRKLTMFQGKAGKQIEKFYKSVTGEAPVDSQWDTDALIGRECTITIAQKPDQNGEMRPEVVAVQRLI